MNFEFSAAWQQYGFGQFAKDTEYRSDEPRISKLARRLVLTGLATAIKVLIPN